ncbi:MAG: DUF6259 domain-containing protein [Clostridiales bacterium]|jgi:hypothetical protein|nr:DUF6259 domain-containing protein [Clostridiales bacterium]
MKLSAGRLALTFCEKSGVVREIRDSLTDTVLAGNASDNPFLLELNEGEFTSEFASFEINGTDSAAALVWRLDKGVVINARVSSEGGMFAFRVNVENNGGSCLCGIEYPLLDGFGKLSERDAVAHSFATGFMVDDPLDNFAEENDGFRHMPYPESFSGASMQFFTYYTEGFGLYFGANDGCFRTKWLDFYKHNGGLRASHAYGYEDIGEGKPLNMDWDFLFGATEGGWYSACEIYRRWALKQVWCRPRLTDGEETAPRTRRADWLDSVGAAAFGVTASQDRSKWIERYGRDFGPVFHITGPDWPNTPQTYGRGIPGGYEDWFPTRFNKNNIEAMKRQGDKFAPFEFDFLIAVEKSDADVIRKNLQKWPKAPKSVDKYTFNMLCPICEYTQNLHITRDVRVAEESGCDAMYYDISANNILQNCMSAEHGHPVGAGSRMTAAYREIYRKTREAMSAARGKYIPLGTEMMNEVFIDVLDFYQARANAQPCSSLETWPYRQLIRRGRARIIPMFQYVYSGFAPLRLDGWGKLTRECGDIVYHTIAKTYLWGGLFEVNSEYSPMEVIDADGENKPEEHYCDFKKRGYLYGTEIAAYLGKFARMRAGKLGRFLARGEMLRPPELKCRRILRTYYQYNHSEKVMEQNDYGIIALDAVIGQAWRLDGQTAVFIANTSAFNEECELKLPWQGEYYAAREPEFDPRPAAPDEFGKFTLLPCETLVILVR